MKLLIDANILLDVLQKREPHYSDSAVIWKLCETEQAVGYVSALTFANMVYIMRKELSPDKIEEIFRALNLIFEFTGLSTADITRASEMRWDDFEDAVQSVIAERVHADYIVTRNIRDFKKSKVMALTPQEIIARL